jgi:hypothetical protein
MTLQRLTEGDILKHLNKSGLSQKVQASQAMEAFRLFVQSELPEVNAEDIEPLFIRHDTLVVRTHIPAVAQLLKDNEEELLSYLNASSNVHVTALRFRA